MARRSVGPSVRRSVGPSVRRSVGPSVRRSVGPSVNRSASFNSFHRHDGRPPDSLIYNLVKFTLLVESTLARILGHEISTEWLRCAYPRHKDTSRQVNRDDYMISVSTSRRPQTIG